MGAKLHRGVHGEKWYGESGKATNENIPYVIIALFVVMLDIVVPVKLEPCSEDLNLCGFAFERPSG